MKTFVLESVKKTELSQVRKFLVDYEYLCTALTSLFAGRASVEDPVNFSVPVSGFCKILKQNNRMRGETALIGVLYVASSGLVYHCLPFFENTCGGGSQKYSRNGNELCCQCTTDEILFFSDELSADDFMHIKILFSALFKQTFVSSIVGSFEATLFLENCLTVFPKEVCTYKLMRLKAAGSFPEAGENFYSPRSCPNGLFISRCCPKQTPFLFPLIKAYYREEVLPLWMDIDDDKLRLLLTGRLRTQFVFGLELPDGAFAATVGTSSIGIGYAQLGSVYTSPPFRRRGYASFLMRHACKTLKSSGYNPILFVRRENTAAQVLYDACGFFVCGDYRIAYF